MLNKIIGIVFIVFVGVCYSQKPMVQLMVDPNVAQVGEEITIKVISNIGGNVNIDLPSAFIQGGTSMSSSQTEYDGNTGKMTTYFYMSNVGIVKKEGNYTFGPAYIKKDRKVFKSNTVTIKIENTVTNSTAPTDFTAKQLKKPAFGVIEKSKSKIYEGEPLVLTSKVYARYEPTHIEGYEPFDLEGAIEKHDIKSSKDSEIKNIKGIEYFCFEANKQLLFPTGKGKFQITPFKMDLKKGFEGFEFTSSSTAIEVIPLPTNAPKNFNDGVGKFSLEKILSKKNFKQGDFIEMTLIVSGEGNIHMINAPQFNLPKELILYGDPIIEEDFTFGVNGSKGSISYKYNIQIKEGGQVYFPQISFSYFDVNKKEYIEVKEAGEKMSISKDEKIVFAKIPNNLNIQKPKAELLTPLNKFETSSKNDNSIGASVYLFAFSSLIVLSILFVVVKKRKESNKLNNEVEFIWKNNINEIRREVELAEEAYNNKDNEKFYSSLQWSILLICNINKQRELSSVINKSDLYSYLEKYSVPNYLLDEVKLIFQNCEEARYGLESYQSSQSQLLDRTKNIVEELIKLLQFENS